MQYRTGTVSVADNDPIVLGAGTGWLANVTVGDIFWIRGDLVSYQVASVDSDTQLTLSAPYQGAANAAANYVVARSYTPVHGYPYPQPGDVDAILVVARAIQEIDTDIGTGGGSGGTGATTLNDLTDVDTAGASNGEVLTYRNGSYVLEPVPAGSVVGTANLGTGRQILTGIVSGNVTARSLIAASTRVSIVQNTNDITIDVPQIGETNAGANVGSAEGLGVYARKNGTTLEFYKLRAGSNVSITQSGDDLIIGATATGGGTTYTAISLGTGKPVYKETSGTEFRFKSVTHGTGLTSTDDGNTITFSLGTINFAGLGDVTITSPTTGQSLRYNANGRWENYTPAAPGIASVSADTNPTLGGNLSVGGFDIRGLRFGMSGFIEKPKAKVYTFVLRSPHPFTIDSLSARTTAGTCTMNWRIGGSSVTGLGSVSVSQTLVTPSASGANSVATNAEVDFVITSPTADIANLAFTISCRRA